MEETKEKEKVGYQFTITQQTGQSQSISVTGNFPENVEETQAFRELARFTECLDAIMKKINVSVLRQMVSDYEKQYQDLETEINMPRLGNKKPSMELISRFNQVKSTLEGNRKALADLSEELVERWNWV